MFLSEKMDARETSDVWLLCIHASEDPLRDFYVLRRWFTSSGKTTVRKYLKGKGRYIQVVLHSYNSITRYTIQSSWCDCIYLSISACSSLAWDLVQIKNDTHTWGQAFVITTQSHYNSRGKWFDGINVVNAFLLDNVLNFKKNVRLRYCRYDTILND